MPDLNQLLAEQREIAEDAETVDARQLPFDQWRANKERFRGALPPTTVLAYIAVVEAALEFVGNAETPLFRLPRVKDLAASLAHLTTILNEGKEP